MASIRQNDYPDAVPDFRNLGVIARVLVGVNLLALAAALYSASSWLQVAEQFISAAAYLEPLLLDGVAQRARHVLLPDHLRELLRAVLAGQDLITHEKNRLYATLSIG